MRRETRDETRRDEMKTRRDEGRRRDERRVRSYKRPTTAAFDIRNSTAIEFTSTRSLEIVDSQLLSAKGYGSLSVK